MAARDESLWIFAYGSLMWRPDFTFVERQRAELSGYHRALCIWSHHYRGTVAKPGLVFGLDRGGSCIGVAFQIAPEAAAETLDAVRRRELITGVYREFVAPVALADGRTVDAVAYAADETHEQYAGRLDPEAILWVVAQAEGVSGANLAYVQNTQSHLLDLGVEDVGLTRLCAALGPTRPPHDPAQ
ncbi:gamma-glutamylcyclotransferase [Lichenifustis flavocetrariae]|uniref:glutathione-specific gamma-glutamylcyclotransferase n=1 Tax=Lichenifustis flavocetrariae TaxID=2949735 RepID=A0AA42CQE7_9HYPH|nr:gamma-glutamylcyclotransferase [Lichenifustis flavocetrariae]MCW6511375.1 gamma-glutamylcyclotransferase [Lichenifustis flavocetrariae]